MEIPMINNTSEVQLALGLENEEIFGPWIRTNNCDSAGQQLADRHYSRQTIGAKRFTRPGKNLVLRTEKGDAVCAVWKGKYRRDHLEAYEITILRNESDHLSSTLAAYACLAAFETFGDIRDGIITYVDEKKVDSQNPGFCFRAIGFKKIGRTEVRNLLIYQLKQHDLKRYFETIKTNEQLKNHFKFLVDDAIQTAKQGDIYEGIEQFAEAMALEQTLMGLYRFAKNKLKIHVAKQEKQSFQFVPCLEDFLLMVYGELLADEIEYWNKIVTEKTVSFYLNNKEIGKQTVL